MGTQRPPFSLNNVKSYGFQGQKQGKKGKNH